MRMKGAEAKKGRSAPEAKRASSSSRRSPASASKIGFGTTRSWSFLHSGTASKLSGMLPSEPIARSTPS